jgi:hypothetical protein
MHPAGNNADYEVRIPAPEVPSGLGPELTRTTETPPSASPSSLRDDHGRNAPTRAPSKHGEADSPSAGVPTTTQPPAQRSAPKPRAVWRKLDF